MAPPPCQICFTFAQGAGMQMCERKHCPERESMEHKLEAEAPPDAKRCGACQKVMDMDTVLRTRCGHMIHQRCYGKRCARCALH